MKDLEHQHQEYLGDPLNENQLFSEPVAQFESWMQHALDSGMEEPHAMILSTVDSLGQPSSRTVLLRSIKEGGFVFYSNYTSRKAVELSSNPQASLLFYWPALHRQIRIEGAVEMLAPKDSDAYFANRPRASKIGAWSSPQSASIPDRKALEDNVRHFTERFGDGDIPRPSFWGGYRLVPKNVEFWQGRESRLHDRLRYQKTQDGWKLERLAP